jgi:hypothetical protein
LSTGEVKTGSPDSDSIVALDQLERDRARMSRDRRHDGRFFTGVRFGSLATGSSQ